MNQNLINLEMAYAPEAYYDEGFRDVIEDHLMILRRDQDTTEIIIGPMQLYKFEFDLARLLRELGVRSELHWIVMRVNGLESMRDVPSDMATLMIPSLTKVNRLLQSHRATGKIN